MYFNPMVNEDMCGIPLMENENCIGIENECEKPGDECAVTVWSDWSPCSVSCGKGLKERRRYFLYSFGNKTFMSCLNAGKLEPWGPGQIQILFSYM